jgi:hypothetical protein
MTPLRKKILTLGRKYDSQIMTVEQAMSLQGTLNSMDDTLTDEEVWMFLSMFAEGREPDIVIRADKPDKAPRKSEGRREGTGLDRWSGVFAVIALGNSNAAMTPPFQERLQ